MKVILFGASGMVGQGVLRECLLDPRVDSVLAIGRSPSGAQNQKLSEILLSNLTDYSSVESRLAGFDACFFCLGVSSAGMKEEDYARVTFDITLAAARMLVRLNPQMIFIYVSGTGTDSSERGRTMWARVKGRTENALLQLPFKAAYMFRPGFIEPLHGIRSKTPAYRVLYAIARPLTPILRILFPSSILTTEQIGRAMIIVGEKGAPKQILESIDILALSRVAN
jgi:uncharacterized protein YbjT (DUF2867 family)